jgi:lipoprotein-anchoring transpeptidase ErfK/SrfK
MQRFGAFVLRAAILLSSPALAQNAASLATKVVPGTPKTAPVKAAPENSQATSPADSTTGVAVASTPTPLPALAVKQPMTIPVETPAKLGMQAAKITTAAPQSATKPIPKYNGPKIEIDVDLTEQEMHIVMPDQTTRDWKISSGRMGLDTPDGTFSVQRLDEQHKSKEYAGAPMPYAIFFDDQGHAIHGTYEHGFGAAHSHGCIRLPVAEAKELFDQVKIAGAEINITGEVDPDFAGDGADGDVPSDRAYGYEPVDPDESDPSPWRDRGGRGSQWYGSSTLPPRHARHEPAEGMRPESDSVGNPAWPSTDSNY